MEQIITSITDNPVLALLGAAVLLTILLMPIVLHIAGLSGAQIVETLKLTLKFFVDVVKAFRDTDSTSLE